MLSEKHEPEFEALPLRLAYSFLAEKGFTQQADAIRISSDRLGSYTTSLRRAKILALLKEKGLLTEFIQSFWPFALSSGGKKKVRFYEQVYSKYESNISVAPSADIEGENGASGDYGKEFAFEAQLRDYLAENLGILEPGLSLWPVNDGDAVEFPVDERGPSRRVDILAKDKDALPVVIELKVSRGHEKTIGQVLYYRSRVKKLFGIEKVRIFIVGSEISQELKCAASEVPDVVLLEYSLAVTVKAV